MLHAPPCSAGQFKRTQELWTPSVRSPSAAATFPAALTSSHKPRRDCRAGRFTAAVRQLRVLILMRRKTCVEGSDLPRLWSSDHALEAVLSSVRAMLGGNLCTKKPTEQSP